MAVTVDTVWTYGSGKGAYSYYTLAGSINLQSDSMLYLISGGDGVDYSRPQFYKNDGTTPLFTPRPIRETSGEGITNVLMAVNLNEYSISRCALQDGWYIDGTGEENILYAQIDPTGTILSYAFSDSGGRIGHVTLSTAWDITSAGTPVSENMPLSEAIGGFLFSNDGLTMWVVYRFADIIHEYTLTTAFTPDASASYVSKTIPSITRINAITFTPDGTKCIINIYLTASDRRTREYPLSTPFSIATLNTSNYTQFTDSIFDLTYENLGFAPDGLSVILGNLQYKLNTANDISSIYGHSIDAGPGLGDIDNEYHSNIFCGVHGFSLVCIGWHQPGGTLWESKISLRKYTAPTTAENIVLRVGAPGASEEYSAIVLEVNGSDQGFYYPGTYSPAVRSSMNGSADGDGIDDFTGFLCGTWDGSQMPYSTTTPAACTLIAAVETTNGGSGSVGSFMLQGPINAPSTSEIFNITASGSDGMSGFKYSLKAAPISNPVPITVTAPITMTATISVTAGIGQNSVLDLISQSTFNANPNFTTSAQCNFVTSTVMFRKSPLIVTDYRFELDTPEADPPTWLADLNTAKTLSYWGADDKETYEYYNAQPYGNDYSCRIRFLVKNINGPTVNLRPIAQLYSRNSENGTTTWRNPWHVSNISYRGDDINNSSDIDAAIRLGNMYKYVANQSIYDLPVDTEYIPISINQPALSLAQDKVSVTNLAETKVFLCSFVSAVYTSSPTVSEIHARAVTYDYTTDTLNENQVLTVLDNGDPLTAPYFIFGRVFFEDPNYVWIAYRSYHGFEIHYMRSTDCITWTKIPDMHYVLTGTNTYRIPTLFLSNKYYSLVMADAPVFMVSDSITSPPVTKATIATGGYETGEILQHPTNPNLLLIIVIEDLNYTASTDVLVVEYNLTTEIATTYSSLNMTWGNTDVVKYKFDQCWFDGSVLNIVTLDEGAGGNRAQYFVKYNIVTNAFEHGKLDKTSNDYTGFSSAPDNTAKNSRFIGASRLTADPISSKWGMPAEIYNLYNGPAYKIPLTRFVHKTNIPNETFPSENLSIEFMSYTPSNGGYSFSRPIYDRLNNLFRDYAYASYITGTFPDASIFFRKYKLVHRDERRQTALQKIGSGTYVSSNKGVLQYGYDDESVCTIAAGEEVEIVVPFGANWQYGSPAGMIDIRLSDFDKLINVEDSITAKFSEYGDSTGLFEGELNAVSTSLLTARVSPDNKINFVSNSTIDLPAYKVSNAKIFIKSRSKVVFRAGTNDVEMVRFDFKADPPNNDWSLSTNGLSRHNVFAVVEHSVNEEYMKDIYAFCDGYERHDSWIYSEYYARFVIRWWLRNSSDTEKSITPAIHSSYNGAAWEKIDDLGSTSYPITTEGWQFYDENSVEAGTQIVVNNPYGTFSTFKAFGYNLAGVEVGTDVIIMQILVNQNNSENFYVKVVFDTITQTVTSADIIFKTSDDPDGPYYSSPTIRHGYNPIAVPNGDILYGAINSVNNEARTYVLRYNTTLDIVENLPIPVPSGYIELNKADFIHIRSTNDDILMVCADKDIDTQWPFICHYNQGTRLYSQGVVISLPGYAAGTFLISSVFPDPITNDVRFIIYDLSNSDLLRCEYNPVTKVFTTPVYMANAITLGLYTIPGIGWDGALPNQDHFSPYSINNTDKVYFYLSSSVSNVLALFYYDTTLDTYYLTYAQVGITPYRLRPVGNSNFLSVDAIVDGSKMLTKYKSDDAHYSIIGYKGHNPNRENGGSPPFDSMYSYWSNALNRFCDVGFQIVGAKAYFGITHDSYEYQDQSDVLPLLNDETHINDNNALLTVHKEPDTAIVLPPNSGVEIVTSLRVYKDWMDDFFLYGGYVEAEDGVFRFALFDDTETINQRNNYAKIVFQNRKLVQAVLNLTSTTTVEFIGDRITGATELFMDTSTVTSFTGTKINIVNPECFMVTDTVADLTGQRVRDALFVYGLITSSKFDILSGATFSASMDATSASEVSLKSAGIFGGKVNGISNTSFSAIPGTVKHTNLDMVSNSVMDIDAKLFGTAHLNINSNSVFHSVGIKSVASKLNLQSLSGFLPLSRSLKRAELFALSDANFDSTAIVSKRNDLSFSSDSELLALGSSFKSGKLTLTTQSAFGLTARPFLSAFIDMGCTAEFNGTLSWNDNRDIILFSSNIERVVEFTLYDNDSNFVQTITTNYPVTWNMSKLNSLDLPINRLQNFDGYIDQVREFELQSVELEPQLFIGDITMKSEYDLNIVSNLSLVSEINTLITYNMQIDKVSDKEILLGL